MNRIKNIENRLVADHSLIHTSAVDLNNPDKLLTVGHYTFKILTPEHRDKVMNMFIEGFTR